MPRIAVITPYYAEPIEKIRRCHDSVRLQGEAVTHFLIADGQPQAAIGDWAASHIVLPATRDVGNTPRLVGAAVAAAQGFDALCFLDADNWFEAGHVDSLLAASTGSGAAIVTCTRTLRRLDGSVLGLCSESDGQGFNDANCYLFRRPAFSLLAIWGFAGAEIAALLDRQLWQAVLESGLPRAHCPLPTVNYESTIYGHYRERGETPPANAKVHIEIDGVWQRRLAADLGLR